MIRFAASRFSTSFAWRPVCVALLLASGGAGCAVPQGGLPLAGTPNFHEVSASFYRSAQPDTVGLAALAQRGIKTVINLRMDGDVMPQEEPVAKAHAIVYRHVPLPGWGRPAEADVKTVLALIESSPQPVLVHCQRGADRTGTIVACYRIHHDGWTAEQALEEAKQYGMAWAQFGMKDFVRDFAAQETARARP